MKKHSLLSLLILLTPLLMANSPSPELFPDEYTSFELTNESIIISEEESTKYITFSGNLQNTGDGIISFNDSYLVYYFENSFHINISFYSDDGGPNHGLLPNQSYSYEKKIVYTGSASLGSITYTSKQIYFYAYQGEDIIQTIEISNQSVTNVNYSESNDVTTFTYSFDWTNSGELSAETFFFSFTMNENDYVYYDWKSISKNAEGHSDLYITFSGDVSTEELENVSLFFIRRSYESNNWDLFGSSFFQGLIVFGIILTSLVVLVPIIVITIVLVIVFRKK